MSRSRSLRFDVTTRTLSGNTVYEAVALIPGFAPVAVEKIEGGTQFSTRSAVTLTCQNRATALGMTPVIRYRTPVVAPAKVTTSATNSAKGVSRKKRVAAR